MSDPPQREQAETRPQPSLRLTDAAGADSIAGKGTIDFVAVVDGYETPLLRYVLNLLRCQHQQAEDVVQDVFLRLHRYTHKHGHNSIKDMASWLFKVAHNLALDSVRQDQRRRQAHQQLANPGTGAAADGASGGGSGGPTSQSSQLDALDELEQKEACQHAMEHLHALPADLKQVLLLKIVQGMTLRQIAEVTGLTPGNAGYRVNRALSELAQKLKSGGVI